MSEGAPKSVVQTEKEPTKVIEINGKKFEIGPYLGELSWDDMSKKVTELNKVLKFGEKGWRLLSKDEYEEPRRVSMGIRKDRTLTDEEKVTKINEYIITLGFTRGTSYWSNVESVTNTDYAYCWDIENSYINSDFKINRKSVQCVREV